MAIKLGRRALIIVEQSYELNLVLQVAQQLGVEAEIGFRMKLSHKGTGALEFVRAASNPNLVYSHTKLWPV